MYLVELVQQGVRGFRHVAHLRFKGGFNMVIAGNESGKTTSTESVQRLLFPSNRAEPLSSLVSRHAPDASRVALVFCSDDGVFYRVLQDLSKRAVNLSKYNAVSKSFSYLHSDWDNAVQFMAGMTAGMSEEEFTKLFLFQRNRRAAGAGMPALTAATRPTPGPAGAPEGMKSPENQERVAELREILLKAEEAADAEYKYQSAKLALDEIEKKIGTIEKTEQKKTEIDSALESLKEYAGLPEDLAGLIDDYERRMATKLADADELNKQIEGVKIQLDSIPTVNIFSDKLFISGVAVGGLSILAGVFVITQDLALLFHAGVLLSLILMAGAWYKGSRKNAQRSQLMREEDDMKKKLVELEKRFQQEGTTVTAALRSTQALSSSELKDKADTYRHFLDLRADFEEQRKRSLGDLSPELLKQQREQQQREVVELEKAAKALAQYNVDTYGIRQDIERLSSNESAAPAGASWNFDAGAPEPPADYGDFSAGGGQRGFLAELGIASRVGGIEMETLVPAVEAAAQRNLVAVTAGKYVRIEAGNEGDPIVHAKDDSVVAFSELSHGTRGLITFCLRAGLVEVLAGKMRFPFILDDALADFDPTRQKAACQVLRSLGAKTQVILFTSNPALMAEGDAAVVLK